MGHHGCIEHCQDAAILRILLTETLPCFLCEKSSRLGNLRPPYGCLRNQICILYIGMNNNTGVCKLRQNIDTALPNNKSHGILCPEFLILLFINVDQLQELTVEQSHICEINSQILT